MMLVKREPIPVMHFEGGADELSTFAELETRLPTLAERKFYATLLGSIYRACVSRRQNESGERYGLEDWEIPGGLYLEQKLSNVHPARLGRLFKEMARTQAEDTARPRIEHYLNYPHFDAVILRLPVQAEDAPN